MDEWQEDDKELAPDAEPEVAADWLEQAIQTDEEEIHCLTEQALQLSGHRQRIPDLHEDLPLGGIELPGDAESLD